MYAHMHANDHQLTDKIGYCHGYAGEEFDQFTFQLCIGGGGRFGRFPSLLFPTDTKTP